MTEETLKELKVVLREADIPFFTDEELGFYYTMNGGDLKKTIYQCLLIKAENTTFSADGLSTGDSSTYFRRLANMYRPTNSGTLGGSV